MAPVEAHRVLVGPAGWSYADWKGIVYPLDMGRNEHPLTFLSSLFDLVEVNATFYRPAVSSHSARWLSKVEGNPRFKFSVKIWDRFTHHRMAWPDAGEIRRFQEGIAPLLESGKLCSLLAQFPWSFRRTPENRQWLARVVEAFAGYPLTVELRHASWEQPEVYSGFSRRQIAFCNIDQPLFEDSVGPSDRTTASFGYVRLHGRNYANWFREQAGRDGRYDYLYSAEELQPWIERVESMKQRVNDLFIVTNNHYRGQAIVNALEIQAALGTVRPALPLRLIEEYPRLKRLVGEGSSGSG